MAGQVEPASPELDHIGSAPFYRRFAAPSATPQDRLYPCMQLAQVDRFCQIVVGAHLQTDDPVDHIARCREHDDRRAAAFAQETGKRQAVLARHVDIEQHGVRVDIIDDVAQLLPVAGTGDRISAQAEIFL